MLTIEERNNFFKILYWSLWKSADFESAFQSDWRLVYDKLEEGKENEISDNVILMLKVWMDE